VTNGTSDHPWKNTVVVVVSEGLHFANQMFVLNCAFGYGAFHFYLITISYLHNCLLWWDDRERDWVAQIA